MDKSQSNNLHPNTKDLSGKHLGRLLVLCKSHSRKVKTGTVLYWKCLCDCGIEVTVPAPSLNSGDAKSCGCLQRERTSEASRTHGMRHTNEFHIWDAMKQRCHNPLNEAYRHYGGRGISVCTEWRESFAQFYMDMGPRPDGFTIERMDNDGDYTPSNCCWASQKQQSRNRRNTVTATHNGLTLPLSEWAERTGIPYQRLIKRLRRGLTGELLLATYKFKTHKI